MFNDFIVGDELHLLELGVMKRCLLGWTGAFKKSKNITKLCAHNIENISRYLVDCNKYMPNRYMSKEKDH